jgi:hypothetical protein
MDKKNSHIIRTIFWLLFFILKLLINSSVNKFFYFSFRIVNMGLFGLWVPNTNFNNISKKCVDPFYWWRKPEYLGRHWKSLSHKVVSSTPYYRWESQLAHQIGDNNTSVIIMNLHYILASWIIMYLYQQYPHD